MRAFTIPASPATPTRKRKGMKIGKKLEAVEEAFCKLPLKDPGEAEATFKALAFARGVTQATYDKRWAIVWHLVKRFCKVVA